MVASRGAATTVAALLFTLLASGCVGDDAPDAGPGTTTTTGPAPTPNVGGSGSVVPTGSSGTLVEVDRDSAVFAPTWSVGRSWTYDVSGSTVGEPYSVTIGVMDDSGDAYVLAPDNDREAEQFVLYGWSLLLDGVQKDTLAVKANGEWHDLIGFERADGARWDARFGPSILEMTRVGVVDMTVAGVEGQGIKTTGAGQLQTLTVEYSEAAAGFASVQWVNNGTLALSYELSAFADSGATTFVQWDVKAASVARATLGFDFFGQTTWTSDGAGDLVLIAGRSQASDNPALGRILDPGMQERMAFQSTTDVATYVWERVDDVSGAWQLLATSTGPQIDMMVWQIDVTP